MIPEIARLNGAGWSARQGNATNSSPFERCRVGSTPCRH